MPDSSKDKIRLTKTINDHKYDVLLIILILCISPIFFFKLGQSSLVSFDEAWYADIARGILKSRNLVNLYWNGNPFIDHPPAGFWLIALSYKLLGVCEFSARFVQALSGLITLIIVFLLGKNLFNRIVGFASAVSLVSSPWFLFRARSGNLDSILVLFFISTVYFAVNASANKKYLPYFIVSLIFLFLIKTAVPFTIIPLLFYIFWKPKIGYKTLTKALIIFIAIVGGWFIYQIINYPNFIKHYFKIGLPGVGANTSLIDNLTLIKQYLHNGIGKWFWPGVASLILGALSIQKRFLILFIFSFTFFIPFLFSQKGHIWQLIPLHPFLILAFYGFAWLLVDKTYNFLINILKQVKRFNKLYTIFSEIKLLVISSFIIIVAFYISFIQTRRNWFEFINIPAFISDEAILSKEAGKYDEKLYIDEDFIPTAVFYSEKVVKQTSRDDLIPLFGTRQKFLLITHQWRLDQSNIKNDRYKILKSDRDKILIISN